MSMLRQAERTSSSLRAWLLNSALPLWWSHGADREAGGFHERLTQEGKPTGEARRGRLHPRQAYSFATGHELGWSVHASAAIRHALAFFLRHYRRSDGLFLKAVGAKGEPGDHNIVLYDQAFALLGLASGYRLLRDDSLRQHAVHTLDAIHVHLRHATHGFKETPAGDTPLLSNSHMHLLEAALGWIDVDAHPRWHAFAAEIVALASADFIDPGTGFILEFFDPHWQPIRDPAIQRIEPGHQFEWAWLLSRWSAYADDQSAQQQAIELFERAESHGIDRTRQVAINALTSTATVLDANARLWPQTERLKAALIAAEFTNNQRYWAIALESAQTLARYLEVPRAGLWRDTLTAAGEFLEEPAPASSLYHIAAAIAQLDRTVRRALRNDSDT